MRGITNDAAFHAVWLYDRFTLSFRDVEDLLTERDVTVPYEAIRLWCHKSGPTFPRNLCRRHGRLADVWQVDNLFITIRGQRRYLRRDVDQDGDVLDILVTRCRDARATKRFFLKLLEKEDRRGSWLPTSCKAMRPPAGNSV